MSTLLPQLVSNISSLSPPTNNIVGWWEADNGITLDTTSGQTTVAQWNDRTGTANNNFIQTTKANQPGITYNSISGLPCVNLTGSPVYMETNGASYSWAMGFYLINIPVAWVASGGYKGIACIRSQAPAQVSDSDIAVYGNLNNTTTLVGYDATGTQSVWFNGASQNITNFTTLTTGVAYPALNQWFLVEWTRTASASGQKYLYIGQDPDNNFIVINIAAILFYSVNDSTTRLAARNYLSTKYNLGLPTT